MWCRVYAVAFCVISVQVICTHAVSIDDRLKCKPNDEPPTTRVNTTERLRAFRGKLATINNTQIVAFIVGTGDAHNSEYPTEHDRRRAFITGFQGSAGTAVITQNKAALWTDGRYFLEADETLDCNWILMKQGLSGVPTYAEWLNDEINQTGAHVGVDQTLITHSSFNSLKDKLLKLSHKLELQALEENPVDEVWGTNQPVQPNSSINALNETFFAGKSWDDKLHDLRLKLESKGAIAFVVTALDETAWLFNLRGSDISYNPFFLSYAILEKDRVRLYILDKDARLSATPSDPETKVTLATHLKTSADGSCRQQPCVEVLNYHLGNILVALTNISLTGKVWITYEANYAIYKATEHNQIIDKSPIALMKSQKNEIERSGMQNAYNRDSAALIKFLAFLENEIKSGKNWTEVSAAAELDSRRKKLQYNRGLSFQTISGYGSNGAIIHYGPSAATDKVISRDSLYLLDSGGQYLDGTTDTTRTMHYGNPTSYEKECYTRVLMAAINLAILKWPQGLYGHQIDAITRAALWEVGFVYRHGTGHGIGAYLSVHEGPGGIGLSASTNPSSETLHQYQFYSDEPGYYENGKFGIRLETVVMVNPTTPKYSTANETFFEFVPITFVPFETNLINYTLLNAKQVEWLNQYNEKTISSIRNLLKEDQRATEWFDARTKKITFNNSASYINIISEFCLILLALFLKFIA